MLCISYMHMKCVGMFKILPLIIIQIYRERNSLLYNSPKSQNVNFLLPPPPPPPPSIMTISVSSILRICSCMIIILKVLYCYYYYFVTLLSVFTSIVYPLSWKIIILLLTQCPCPFISFHFSGISIASGRTQSSEILVDMWWNPQMQSVTSPAVPCQVVLLYGEIDELGIHRCP